MEHVILKAGKYKLVAWLPLVLPNQKKVIIALHITMLMQAVARARTSQQFCEGYHIAWYNLRDW